MSMSASNRGRARGRVAGEGTAKSASRGGARSTTPGGPAPRPPSSDTIRRLGLSSVDGDTASGQFDDATVDQDKHSATGTMVASHASPIEGNKSNIEAAQTHTATTTSDSSFRPMTPEFSPPTTRLNPSAPVFSPTSSSSALSSSISTTNTKLNPTTPEFSPITGMNGGVNTTTSHSNTQYSTLKTITAVTNKHSTTLNPRTGEFIPKISPIYMYSTGSANSSLNASAPAFVPTESHPSDMQNGQLGIDEQELPIPRPAPTVHDGFDEEEPLSLTPGDIISGFERPVKQTGDVGSESLLKATAEVLIKATMYPGSFDRGKMKLEHTVNAWTPTEGILANLAEMLIHWGIMESSLRLSSSRICQVLNDMDILRRVFNKQMLLRLEVWYRRKIPTDKEQLINFSLFFAEMFSRLRMKDQDTPIHILGKAVKNLLTKLLEGKDERSVINACHILKLTGPLLDIIQKDDSTDTMNQIITTLERLSTDETLPLSSKCVEIMVRVLELHSQNWGNSRPLASAGTSSPTPLSQFMLGSLATTGAEFDVEAAENTASMMPRGYEDTPQAPVSNPEEWNEFLDVDNLPIEEIPTSEEFVMAGGVGNGGDEDDELDAEMQKEFEFFVQDLEEHLLNVGEMDPEQFVEDVQ